MKVFLIDYSIGNIERSVIVQGETRLEALQRAASTEPDDTTIVITACQYLAPETVFQVREIVK